jgi:hypothetical protein
VFVEISDGRLSVAAELALSGSGGVAGLQRMSAPQKLAAFFALTAVDREFADDGLARNLGLKLSIEMIFDDIATTTGTAIVPKRVEFFIDSVWGAAVRVIVATFNIPCKTTLNKHKNTPWSILSPQEKLPLYCQNHPTESFPAPVN